MKEDKIIKAVEYLTEYMKTYPNQRGYESYCEETYILDVLYGLGVSLGKEYRFANGFEEFKKVLLEVINDL